MRVAILQSAKDDLRDGFLFYESQGGSYLGNYFHASLQSDMSSLALYAGIHNKRFGFHRALVRHDLQGRVAGAFASHSSLLFT